MNLLRKDTFSRFPQKIGQVEQQTTMGTIFTHQQLQSKAGLRIKLPGSRNRKWLLYTDLIRSDVFVFWL